MSQSKTVEECEEPVRNRGGEAALTKRTTETIHDWQKVNKEALPKHGIEPSVT